MSRVSKVILGAHAILTNGGMFAVTGSLLTATAARAHSTTVMVCAGQFKLTPLWNLYHEYGALDFDDPSGVLGFEEGDLVDKVDVVNPYYDYVRPELVDVYVTNEYAYFLLLSICFPLLTDTLQRRSPTTVDVPVRAHYHRVCT
jgi:translation initiation factor eIF-2B subunit beta